MVKTVAASLERLLAYARAATQGQARPVTDHSSLAKRMNVSPQTMNAWKDRGVSRDGVLAAEALFGCSANWVRTGEGAAGPALLQATERPARWTSEQHPTKGVAAGATVLAHTVSHDPQSHAMLIAWERLMASDLPALFRVQLQDDALAPLLQRGDELVIDRNVAAEPGDIVLVRDARGNHYARLYRVRVKGTWSAHSSNAAYEPMEADRDQLQLVGVSVTEIRNRRRSASR